MSDIKSLKYTQIDYLTQKQRDDIAVFHLENTLSPYHTLMTIKDLDWYLYALTGHQRKASDYLINIIQNLKQDLKTCSNVVNISDPVLTTNYQRDIAWHRDAAVGDFNVRAIVTLSGPGTLFVQAKDSLNNIENITDHSLPSSIERLQSGELAFFLLNNTTGAIHSNPSGDVPRMVLMYNIHLTYSDTTCAETEHGVSFVNTVLGIINAFSCSWLHFSIFDGCEV